MKFLERVLLKRHLNKRMIFAMVLFTIATISIVLSQSKDMELNELQNKRVEMLIGTIGVKLSFTEIKVSMNEYLLRYLSSDIQNKFVNEQFEVIQAVPGKGVEIVEFSPNLTSWFDEHQNIQWYFGDVGNLNSVRPMWEKSEANFMEYLLGTNIDFERKIKTKKFQRDFYRTLSYVFNILGILVLIMTLKPKPKEEKGSA